MSNSRRGDTVRKRKGEERERELEREGRELERHVMCTGEEHKDYHK